MNLNLGFVKKESRFIQAEFYVIWGALLIVLLMSIYFFRDYSYLHKNNDELRQEIIKFNSKLDEKKRLLKGAPSINEFNALKKRILVVNELAALQGAGLSSVLSQLEAILPQKAYVTHLSYKPKRNEVLMTVEAPGSEQLTEMLFLVENSKYFSEVLLRRQSQAKRKGQRYLQFEMSLVLTKSPDKKYNE